MKRFIQASTRLALLGWLQVAAGPIQSSQLYVPWLMDSSLFSVAFAGSSGVARGGAGFLFVRLSQNSVGAGSLDEGTVDMVPRSLDFGLVLIGQTKDLTLTLRNHGNTLTVNSIAISNAAFHLVSPALPVSLATGATQSLVVRFSPVIPGRQDGTLAVLNLTASLTGTGEAAAAGTGDCGYFVNPLTSTVPAEGGTGLILVSTRPGCRWNAEVGASWVTILAGSTGTGSGAISYRADSHQSPAARTATITVGGFGPAVTHTITQTGFAGPTCRYEITPPALTLGATAGETSVFITTGANCVWQARSSTPWLTIKGADSGIGPATLSIAYGANTAQQTRSATLTIGNVSVPVTQAAALRCTYTLAPSAVTVLAAGTTGTVAVTTDSNCPWTAASDANWLSVISGTSGVGSGIVGYRVGANTSLDARTATITIGGQRFVVSQASAQPNPGGPDISTGGVVNAADFGRTIAPGTMVTIYGAGLAPRTAAASSVPLPQALEGTSVEVVEAGQATTAPLYFVSSRQVNVQMPFGLRSTTVQVRVRNAQGVSGAEVVPIRPRAPRLFTKAMDGQGEAVVLHALDFQFVSQAYPAQPGEHLVIYLTGLGEVTPSIAAGLPGGDGGRMGPLNMVTETVSVTLGDKPARVSFAGLAPGLPGIYQVNIEVPADSLEERPAVVVSAGGSASQANVWLSTGPRVKPEDVVRLALEAQIRGDLVGMMELCDMDAYGPVARAKSVELLETIKSAATFGAFRFTPLATVLTSDGDVAFVRALISYRITTREGAYPMTHGAIAMLALRGSQWKLRHLTPDELLNLELHEANQRSSPSARLGAIMSLTELNQRINDALKRGYIDKQDLALQGVFAGVGQIPIWGDFLADIYQVCDTIKNAKEAIQEYWENGYTGIGVIKVQQVGMGVLQIVVEPIPGLDMQSDMAQAALGQLAHNLTIARALNDFKLRLAKLGEIIFPQTPRLFLLDPGRWEYPQGMEAVFDPGAPSGGSSLASVAFGSFAALGKRFPLRVVVDYQIAPGSPVYQAGPYLGEKRGDSFYVALDVTHLTQEQVTSRDIVLDDFAVSQVVSWSVSCRRGAQLVAVRLRNGQLTPEIRVVNRAVNQITDLRLTGASETGIVLEKDERLGGLKVVGVSPSVDSSRWPDLSNRPECLLMRIDAPHVAELERAGGENTVTIVAKSPGATLLRLELPGSVPEEGVPLVSKTIPIEVRGSPLDCDCADLQKTNSLRGDISLGEKRNSISGLGGCLNSRLQWAGAAFSIDCQEASPAPSKETTRLIVRGAVNETGRRLTSASWRREWTSYSGDTNTRVECTVRDVPIGGGNGFYQAILENAKPEVNFADCLINGQRVFTAEERPTIWMIFSSR